MKQKEWLEIVRYTKNINKFDKFRKEVIGLVMAKPSGYNMSLNNFKERYTKNDIMKWVEYVC